MIKMPATFATVQCFTLAVLMLISTALSANLQELQAAIAAVLEKQSVPAVGIAMVDENGPVWIGALGKSNLETRLTLFLLQCQPTGCRLHC